ncbi:MAG: FeoA family protein [Candidatus Methanosuratincola petrocarbonis]
MFGIADAASAFLFGTKPDRQVMNKDDGNACSETSSEPKVEEPSDDNEKNEQCIINEYYRLSKKKRYSLEELVPLAALEEGQKGKIVLAVGGRKLISRLCDLGLTPETEFKVLKKGLLEGPIILEIRSCELAIGRGIASKVLVKPL